MNQTQPMYCRTANNYKSVCSDNRGQVNLDLNLLKYKKKQEDWARLFPKIHLPYTDSYSYEFTLVP